MPVSDDKILFDALRKAGAPEDMAYTAVQEVRNMAGQNVTAELGARIAELGTKTDSKFAELGAKTDAKFAELGTNTDAKFAELGTNTDAKFAGTDAKFAGTDAKIAGADAKIDSMRAEIMARLDAERRIVWTLLLLIAAAVLADLFRG